MKITEHEMRGLLAGKCVPGDMRVNEELPAYLVRKFAALQQKLDASEEKVRQLEWDSVFIPKDIEAALAVMGVALPASKEEFNLSINRWIQRLVDRVVRIGPELDAERNNLRAEGAELCVRALVTSDDDEFTDAPNVCTQIAAQLRAAAPKGDSDEVKP